jgi:hypothetical protein
MKDAENPHFRSSYATLASVIDVVRAPLAKHGLAFVQTTEPSERGITVITELLHESGEWLSSKLHLPVTKPDAQGYGSAISYARRYALMGVCGVASADEDDDAERAVAGSDRAERPAEKPKPRPAEVTTVANAGDEEETTAILEGLLNVKTATDLQKLAIRANAGKRAKRFTPEQYKRILQYHERATAELLREAEESA